MTFEEDIKRLEPILGKNQARRLFRAWLMEDRDGQEDIYRWVRLRLEQKLGHNLLSAGQFLSLPSKDDANGKYFLGNVMQAGKPAYPFGLRDGEMFQHLGIFGRSGAGKTNMCALLMRSLIEHRKPFLLFDWKRNGRDLITEPGFPLEIYTVGRNVCPFKFNVLIPPRGTPARVWLKSAVIPAACNGFYLGEGVSYLLQEAVDAVYQRFGIYGNPAPQSYPTMRDVLEELRQTTAKGRKGMWMDSALRAVQTLCFGPISEVVNVSRNDGLEELLSEYAVLEVDALANPEKVFLIEILLMWIHRYRLTEPQREVFKHCIIVDEAHQILRPTEKDDVINDICREVREFGEALVFLDQHPSLMSIPSMGNTYCTVALNVKHNRDVQALGDAMQIPLKDRGLLGELHTGYGVIKLQSRFTQPFLIQIPKVHIRKGTVTDDDLRARYDSDSGHSAESDPSESAFIDSEPISPDRKSSVLTKDEENLLKDTISFPLDSIIKRYSRLNLSRRRGNAGKDSLIEKGVLVRVPIPVRAGQVVLLTPSEGMKQALERKGMTFNNREGGVVHQFWKKEIRMALEKIGWTVEEEKSVGNGQQVDLHAERNGMTLAVEVETGSRGILNAEKALNAGYDMVMSFSVNGHAKATMERQIVEKALSADRLILATPVDYEQVIENMSRREKAADRKV